MNKRWLLGTCAVVFGFLNGYIYEVRVLRTWNYASQRYQYFIGLSDFHDKTNPVNNSQLQSLNSIFSACYQHKPKIIVEDITSPGSCGRMCCGSYFVDTNGGILSKITPMCTSCGLKDIENIEYRYCRVTSLGPIINNITRPLNAFASSNTIKVSALIDEIDTIRREITTYQDVHEQINNYYTSTLHDIDYEMSQLELRECASQTVAAYLADHEQYADRLELVKQLLTFDSALLDTKILHAISVTTNTDTIIAAAGGAHIDRVCEVLEKSGYERVYGSKVKMVKESDPSKCIGCTLLRDNSCLKPKPIDLNVLARFM